jgi:hypothetical protein
MFVAMLIGRDVLTAHVRHSTDSPGIEASSPHISHSPGSRISSNDGNSPKPHWPRAFPRQSRCRRNATAKQPARFSNRGFGDLALVKRGFQSRTTNSSDVDYVTFLLFSSFLSYLGHLSG